MATNPPTQSRDDAKPAKAPTEQNKLVKDLDLSSVEQELVAKEARRIAKEKEWRCAKMAIKNILIPFASTEEARSMGLSHRFLTGKDHQLEKIRFEINEGAVEIEVAPKISEPADGIKVIKQDPKDRTKKLEIDITKKLADLKPAHAKQIAEELIREHGLTSIEA